MIAWLWGAFNTGTMTVTHAQSSCLQLQMQSWSFLGSNDVCNVIWFLMVTCRFYVEAEGRQLMETLEALVREESWRPQEDEAGPSILRCASELFGVIKKSLNRCSRFVSRGAAMLQLAGEFQVRDY